MIDTLIRLTSKQIITENGEILWHVGESVPRKIYDSELRMMVYNPYYDLADYDVFLVDNTKLSLVKNK